MSEIDKQSITDYMKTLSKEGQEIAAKNIDIDILWDVLRSKETEERNTLQKMRKLVGVGK